MAELSEKNCVAEPGGGAVAATLEVHGFRRFRSGSTKRRPASGRNTAVKLDLRGEDLKKTMICT